MDGFMDASDAMASWQTKERRLEILKDSHTGAFAVIGCAGYILLSAAVYGEIPVQTAPMLMGVFVISRALSALALAFFKSARPGGVTGDLAGWFVQITELALAAVIVLGGKMG